MRGDLNLLLIPPSSDDAYTCVYIFLEYFITAKLFFFKQQKWNKLFTVYKLFLYTIYNTYHFSKSITNLNYSFWQWRNIPFWAVLSVFKTSPLIKHEGWFQSVLLEAVLCAHPDTSARVCSSRVKGPEQRANASLISPCPCHTDYCVLLIFSYLKGYSILYL